MKIIAICGHFENSFSSSSENYFRSWSCEFLWEFFSVLQYCWVTLFLILLGISSIYSHWILPEDLPEILPRVVPRIHFSIILLDVPFVIPKLLVFFPRILPGNYLEILTKKLRENNLRKYIQKNWWRLVEELSNELMIEIKGEFLVEVPKELREHIMAKLL